MNSEPDTKLIHTYKSENIFYGEPKNANCLKHR